MPVDRRADGFEPIGAAHGPLVQGGYLMPSYGRYVAAEVLEILEREPVARIESGERRSYTSACTSNR